MTRKLDKQVWKPQINYSLFANEEKQELLNRKINIAAIAGSVQLITCTFLKYITDWLLADPLLFSSLSAMNGGPQILMILEFGRPYCVFKYLVYNLSPDHEAM